METKLRFSVYSKEKTTLILHISSQFQKRLQQYLKLLIDMISIVLAFSVIQLIMFVTAHVFNFFKNFLLDKNEIIYIIRAIIGPFCFSDFYRFHASVS